MTHISVHWLWKSKWMKSLFSILLKLIGIFLYKNIKLPWGNSLWFRLPAVQFFMSSINLEPQNDKQKNILVKGIENVGMISINKSRSSIYQNVCTGVSQPIIIIIISFIFAMFDINIIRLNMGLAHTISIWLLNPIKWWYFLY